MVELAKPYLIDRPTGGLRQVYKFTDIAAEREERDKELAVEKKHFNTLMMLLLENKIVIEPSGDGFKLVTTWKTSEEWQMQHKKDQQNLVSCVEDLEETQAALAKAEKEVDRLQEQLVDMTTCADTCKERADKAEAEVIRLKKMLGIGIGGKQ